MYTKMDNSGVEDVCYEKEHIEKVMEVIRNNFDQYFMRFLDSTAGRGLSLEEIQRLQNKFKIGGQSNKKNKDLSENFKAIICEAIDDFEKDRGDYEKIFRKEWLEDSDDDAYSFKSKTLKNECPIIRKTLANKKAKELDKYRISFSMADAEQLLNVVYNLCVFGDEHQKQYDPDTYEDAQTYRDLDFALLDTDEYTAFGVIGGGIKSHMLYKVHPAIFPNRSRSAIWALWYLTGQKTFGCRTDSEFLMIDRDKTITQQNYFYPYQLFAYYAFEIYKMLRDKAKDYNVYIDTDYRYVIVDAFLEYVAMEHYEDISFFKKQLKDGVRGDA